MNGGMDLVEAEDFDQDGRNSWRPAGDELQFAHGCEEGSAAADGVLPAFAGLKAEAAEEATELVVGIGRWDCLDERNSLDHEYDCIVWSCGGSCDEF
jgi:hypothetical protein